MAFAGLGLAVAAAFWTLGQGGALRGPVIATATASTAPNRPTKPDNADATLRARERRAARAAAGVPPTGVAAAPQGVVQFAISPWGQVEIDGVAAGTTPPLSRLSLPSGTHQIVVRNDDFPPFVTTVTVNDEKPVTLRHRFGL